MMASSSPLLESGLLGIALVIRSRDGPRFVFHYPPRPNTKTSRRKGLYGTELNESDSEDEANGHYDDIDGPDVPDSGYSSSRSTKLDQSDILDHVEHIEGNTHFDSANGEHVVPWEHLFNFPTTDLESILTPSRAYHKRKFELSLDPLYFVSYPMHIRPDGLWKKRRFKKSKKSKVALSDSVVLVKDDVADGENGDKSGNATPAELNPDEGEDHGGMTMFNVVFVLNLPKDEADERIVNIYEHVIKQFNKALSHGQATANYVWKESEMILSMKEKAREESMSFPST